MSFDIPQDIYKRRTITAIVGKTGYGKSYFTKQLLYGDPTNRIVIFDVMVEYGFLVEKDYKIFYDVDNFKQYMSDNYDGKIKAIIQFDDVDDYLQAFQICYIVGSIMVVVEEIHQYSNQFGTVKPLEKIIRFGRHKQVSLICITHRFTDLSLIIRQNLDVVVFFRCSTGAEIKMFKDYEYINNQAENIATLKKQEFIICKNI